MIFWLCALLGTVAVEYFLFYGLFSLVVFLFGPIIALLGATVSAFIRYV